MERDESGEKDRELGRELSRGAEEKRAVQEGREPKSPEPKAPRQSFTLSVLIPALVATALWLLFSILGDESAKVGGELTAVKNLYDETAARVSNLESRVKELGDKNAVVANGGTAPKPVPIPAPAAKPAKPKKGKVNPQDVAPVEHKKFKGTYQD